MKKTASSRPAKRPAKLAAPSKTIEAAVSKHGVYKGNVMTPLQFSTFVRTTNESECNGKTFKIGKLRAFDLGPFVTGSSFHRAVADIVNNRFTEECIVYIWRICKAQTYGATITDTRHRVLDRIPTPRGNRTYKMNVIRYLEAAAGIKSPPALTARVAK